MLKLSDEDYAAKVAYLRDRSPDHPLLEKLSKGNSVLNSIYVVNAVNDLPKPKAVVPKRDPRLNELEINIRHHRLSRAELSNQLARCTTDHERRKVSDAILAINVLLKDWNSKLEAFDTHNQAPDLPASDQYPVPDDPVQRYKKLHSLRTQITATEKNIKSALDRAIDPSKIIEKEQTLSKLKIHRMYVQQAINRDKTV